MFLGIDVGTEVFPWDEAHDPMVAARERLDAAFEFFSKLGVPYYCFHERDMAPESGSLTESERNLATLVALAKERQRETGVKLLWGGREGYANHTTLAGHWKWPSEYAKTRPLPSGGDSATAALTAATAPASSRASWTWPHCASRRNAAANPRIAAASGSGSRMSSTSTCSAGH